MKTVEDFILWTLKNGSLSKNEIFRKLGIFGFDSKEIEQAQMNLIKQGKITCVGCMLSSSVSVSI